MFRYELYDLKNCWDIKMYSGVIHHIVLLIIFPLGWVSTKFFANAKMLTRTQYATTMSVPAMCMVSMTYLSNIPAHFRSFMVILGLCYMNHSR